MTSPVQPTEEERAETMSLERHVAAIIGNGMVTRESPLSIAHHAVALVREQIAHDIEAEKGTLPPGGHYALGWYAAINLAARIARGGVS